jgi:hypothetical protein
MNLTRNRHVKVAAILGIVACVAGASAGCVRSEARPNDRDRNGDPHVVASLADLRRGLVIAETTDLPRVRQDGGDGRRRPLLIPDLPKATYGVWARGYGLVDSPR